MVLNILEQFCIYSNSFHVKSVLFYLLILFINQIIFLGFYKFDINVFLRFLCFIFIIVLFLDSVLLILVFLFLDFYTCEVFIGRRIMVVNLLYLNNLILFFIIEKFNSLINIKHTPYLLCLFCLSLNILYFNIVGLIPYLLALTGNFIFPFYFSLMFFICNIILGFLGYKFKFFGLFLPDNVPLFIIPVLIVIEIISFFSKIFSLSIRLFANIVAGHILLKILISFLYIIISYTISVYYPLFFSLVMLFIIILLEVFIAFLQVYIFILLLIVYLNTVVRLH